MECIKLFIDYPQHVTELTKFILYPIIYSYLIRHKWKTFGIEYIEYGRIVRGELV